MENRRQMTRRVALQTVAGASALGQRPPGTEFQIACMTIPFQVFSFERGVKGVAAAGFRYLAWGPNQTDASGGRMDTISLDAGPARAKELLRISRDAGLETILMFATAYPENPGAVAAYRKRIDQPQEAGIPNLLAFGSPKSTSEHRAKFVRTLEAVADHARQASVSVCVKQHGGVTATGELTAFVVRDVNHRKRRAVLRRWKYMVVRERRCEPRFSEMCLYGTRLRHQGLPFLCRSARRRRTRLRPDGSLRDARRSCTQRRQDSTGL